MSLWSRRVACLHARGHAQLYLAVSVMPLPFMAGNEGRFVGKHFLLQASLQAYYPLVKLLSHLCMCSCCVHMCVSVCICLPQLPSEGQRSTSGALYTLHLIWDRASSSRLCVLNQLPDKHLGLLCLYFSSCRRIVLRGVCYCIWLPVGFEAWNLGPHLWQLFQMHFERSCWVWKELIGALNLVSLGSFLGV